MPSPTDLEDHNILAGIVEAVPLGATSSKARDVTQVLAGDPPAVSALWDQIKDESDEDR